MSSYIAQIMCYACNQTLTTVYEQSRPSSQEESTYQITGWTEPSWVSSSANWNKWTNFCNARLFEDSSITLARTWTIGPNVTYKAYNNAGEELPDKHCWVDATGIFPIVKGDEGVYKCEISGGTSVCGELWYYLSTGNKHNLCAGCSGSTQV